MRFILLWLCGISLLAVIMTLLDKSRSRHGGHRVAEATLFTVALLGGAAAMWMVMHCIRHKTRHRRFMWGLPLIILLHFFLFFRYFVV